MSFKLKLVAYFLILSLLPLGAAGWALHSVTSRSETRRVDVRLEAGLHAVLASYKTELAAANRRARALARLPAFQQALQRRDQAELRRLVLARRGLRLEANGFAVGPAEMVGHRSSISIVGGKGRAGTLVAGIPLATASLDRLSVLAGLDSEDELVVLDDGRVAAGPPALRGAIVPAPPRARTSRRRPRPLPSPRGQPAGGDEEPRPRLARAAGPDRRRRRDRRPATPHRPASLARVRRHRRLHRRPLDRRLSRTPRHRRECDRARPARPPRRGAGPRRVRPPRPRLQRDGRPARGAAGGARRGARAGCATRPSGSARRSRPRTTSTSCCA